MPAPVGPGTRAVFFDAVGTLLFPDPPAAVVYAAAARRAGVNLSPAEIRARFVAAYRVEEEADRTAGWVTSEERERDRWRAIVAATLRELPDPDAAFDELYDHFSKPAAWRVAPHAADVIARLGSRGLVVGMGSNYDARLRSVLDGLPELGALRGRVVVSSAIGFRKPAAEFFREVVRIAGCSPHEILFVGDDAENDYEGATAAGLRAVLLDPRGARAGLGTAVADPGELLD